ncbi:hypothetical protein N9W89_09495 [Hellea sp.]|nr:hypothetical protein [Hellea sp.]
MSMNEHMMASPTWVVIWMGIMGLLHIAAIPFAIKDWRPRIMVIVMIINMMFMGALFHTYGYTRILGLSHVIFWTPLLAYLWKSRNKDPERVWTGRFVKLAIVIIFISLLFDYTDVVRYVLGDRAVMSG